MYFCSSLNLWHLFPGPGHHSTSTCHRILGQSLTTDIADTVKFIAPNSQHFHFPLNVLTFTIPILYRVQWTEPHLGYIQVNDHRFLAHLFTVYWGISTSINLIVIGSANGVSSVWCFVIVCTSTALSLNHTIISVIDDNKVTMPNGQYTRLLSTEHRLIPNTMGDNHSFAPVYKRKILRYSLIRAWENIKRQPSNSSCVISVGTKCGAYKRVTTRDYLPISLGPTHTRSYSRTWYQISSCWKFHHSGFGRDE